MLTPVGPIDSPPPQIRLLWSRRWFSLKDILAGKERVSLYEIVRSLWLALRQLFSKALGRQRLDVVLWHLGFFHLKSRLLRKQTTTPDGHTIFLRPMEENILREIYDEKSYGPCRFTANSTIIDCGAHIGLFSLYAAKRAPQGRILAFEPSPLNRELLLRNLALNSIKNVEAYPWAVSDHRGPGKIHFGGEYANDYCEVPVIGHPSSITISINLRTLDDIFLEQRIERCDLLKIDVEGSEIAVLRGAARALTVSNQVVMEIHKLAVNPKELVKTIAANGFSYKLYGETPFIIFLYAWRQ